MNEKEGSVSIDTVEIVVSGESEQSPTERSALVVNPAKICQPIGAVHAALGFHGVMPLSHGSQGCLAYLRMCLSRHYREPVASVSSSFYEGTAVFGGRKNLQEAITNVIEVYKPEAIAIHTTCVAETIGDDVKAIVEDLRQEGDIDENYLIASASTPSYVGSHVTGYDNMVKGFIEAFGGKTGTPSDVINIIPGFVEPSDIREIKRLTRLMDIKTLIFPDQTDVLDTPLTGKYDLYPKGGTQIADLATVGDSLATFALNKTAGGGTAKFIEGRYKVGAISDIVPIGINNTDRFIFELSKISGKPVPEELNDERGRLVDMVTDAHPHFHGKKVAIFGDPDVIRGLASFVASLGMIPRYILTGSKGDTIRDDIAADLVAVGFNLGETDIMVASDLLHLEEAIKKESVDLIIGNTYGKLIAKTYDIPLVRVGFPIMDRANLQHFPIYGYAGAANLIERIGNTLLDEFDRKVSMDLLEIVM